MSKYITVLLIALIKLLIPQEVLAHPLDEIGDVRTYDQTQKITVTPENVILTINLTFYPLDKIKIWESIDKNRDEVISEEEKNIWMNLGSDASWLELAGEKYQFTAQELTFPGYYDFFDSKPAKVEINFFSETPFSEGKLYYFYKGKDKPLSEINFEAKGDNGLMVQDVIKESPESVSFSVVKGVQSSMQKIGLNSTKRLDKFLNTYVKVEKIPVGLGVIAFLTAYLIGMLHALTPGHGKAIVAGYLVGEKGTVSHAIQLGLIITITHTASVFLLGVAALLLTQYFVPSEIVRAMNTVSGILIAGFGSYLLVTRITGLIYGSLEHAHNHSNNIPHSHDDHDHHHKEIELTWKNLLPLGISGGIVPCIDALAILIVAISLGKTLFGIGLLILFSLGLASALIISGVAVVIAKNKAVKKIQKLEHYQKYISIISALIVTILGLFILLGKQI